MEPTSLIGAGILAYASKDLIAKLLGPSADYIGGEIKGLVEKCNINLGDIFNKAGRKAGNSLEEDSQVNPRVLKSIVGDGSFCDDDLLKEYYAGILSSSRTTDSSNDIGVSLLAVLKALSVYQVRLHYLFYTEFYRNYSKKPCHLGEQTERKKRRLYIPYQVFLTAMQSQGSEQVDTILPHSITGLVKNGLVGDTWQYGTPESIKKYFKEAEQPGIILEPSLPGAELYIWANGKLKLPPANFLLQNSMDQQIQFPIVDGSLPTHNDT